MALDKTSFGGRRRELEDKFFAERDRELLAALRAEAAARERKAALADASGIADADLIAQLDELDVCGETLAAVCLIPLIAVAWSDGAVDGGEKKAVMAAAEEAGVKDGHPAHDLLERWLGKKPDDTLLGVWRSYVRELLPKLTGLARAALKKEIIGHAQMVAKATGGILGLGNKISAAEQTVIDDLAATFE
jgi:hypothetical protein